MRVLSKSEKFLIALLIIMAVGYVYYQYIFTPISKKLVSTRENISNYRTELNQNQILLASNNKLEEEIKELQSKFYEYAADIPKSEREPQILHDLKNLWENKSLNITSITLGAGMPFSETAAKEGGTETGVDVKPMIVPLSIDFSGSYDNVMSFIQELEDSKRITEINSINFSQASDNFADSTVNTKLTASIIYVEDGSEVERQYDFNNGSYGNRNLFR
jgi:type IV pilus assembly protein PilO